jgi:outer membrane protein assembly factor BamC
VIRSSTTSIAAAVAVLASSLAACSSIENTVAGEKVDYKAAKAKVTPLEVPPDLTQLSVDPRYLPQAGAVSASTLQGAAPIIAASASAPQTVATTDVGDARIERDGSQRWISSSLPPEKLWPTLEQFWQERGLTLSQNKPDLGVMETEWAENRANLPQDLLRRTLGKVIDSLYDTGLRDKYRLRVERSARGSDIFISHRGMEEIYPNSEKDQTVWQPRATDPQLESEMLSRLLVKLGATAQVAKAEVAQAAPLTAARARIVEGRPAATLQLDDGFDRAWRRVGLALDRSGFTVEDRDRAQGLYYVRYVDPAQAGKEEPGFFGKMFGKDKLAGPVRYRVNVKSEGDKTIVAVLTNSGEPENGDAGKRIVKILVDDLK